jgi:hypothetical protein
MQFQAFSYDDTWGSLNSEEMGATSFASYRPTSILIESGRGCSSPQAANGTQKLADVF